MSLPEYVAEESDGSGTSGQGYHCSPLAGSAVPAMVYMMSVVSYVDGTYSGDSYVEDSGYCSSDSDSTGVAGYVEGASSAV